MKGIRKKILLKAFQDTLIYEKSPNKFVGFGTGKAVTTESHLKREIRAMQKRERELKKLEAY